MWDCVYIWTMKVVKKGPADGTTTGKLNLTASANFHAYLTKSYAK